MLRTLVAVGVLCAPAALLGQDTVNIGAVLKYTGGPAHLAELKDTNLYLESLETQAASDMLKLGGVRYIDRVSVNQIFGELNLSSDAAFNGSSGALRGLLGRLDVLVVLDASDSSLARIRAIDLQDGSVREAATCKRGFFSSPSDGAADCIKDFSAGLVPVVHELAAAKAQRRMDAQHRAKEAADAAQKATAERDAEARRRDQADRAAQARAEAEQAAERRAAQTEQAEARRAAEENARILEAKRSAVADLQPQLADGIARLQASDSFWGGMQRSLASQGRSLRSEVRMLMSAADASGQRCKNMARSFDAPGLKACLADLSGRLDKLEAYK